jgi:hypothetical protein
MDSSASLGMEGFLGINFAGFFIEHTMAWYLPGYFITFGDPRTHDAVYFSVLGANAGIQLPFLPADFYVGLDYGDYRLSSGTNPRFGGLGLHVGTKFYFTPGSVVGAVAEYRHHIATEDDSGALPRSISSSADLYFIGVVFGKR